MALVLEAMAAERDVPEYISVDERKMAATFVRSRSLKTSYPVQMESRIWSSSITLADHSDD